MNELFIAVKGALIFTIAWIALMAFLTWENPFRHFTAGFIARIYAATVAVIWMVC